jgi:hypothetical protein
LLKARDTIDHITLVKEYQESIADSFYGDFGFFSGSLLRALSAAVTAMI